MCDFCYHPKLCLISNIPSIKTKKGEYLMIKFKLETLYLLNQRIQQIEKEMEKGKTMYQHNLTLCKKAKTELISEGLLEKLNLPPLHLDMAKYHYYEGRTWECAYACVLAKEEESQEEESQEEDVDMRELAKRQRTIEKQINRKIEKAIAEDINSPITNQKCSEERIVHITQQTTEEELKITKEPIEEEAMTEFAKKQKERGIQIPRIDKRTTQKGQE